MRELVEPDRVHRAVYLSAEIFQQELLRIFERIWIYCGHESQIPSPGDFHTFDIGRQPMIMVRRPDRGISVLHNRCPHRGVQLCASHSGNLRGAIVCPYHAWTFGLDGRIKGLPLPRGYEGTRLTRDSPECSIQRAARVDSHRGFVFASLAESGETLEEFLGEARAVFDNLCDRSPEGEVEVVPVCHRVVQQSNWKFFMENQLDGLHAPATHQAAAIAAKRAEDDMRANGKVPPQHYYLLSAVASSFAKFDAIRSVGYPHGHGVLQAYMDLRGTDADSKEYIAAMYAAYGPERAEAYLRRDVHHALIYPYLSIQPVAQQLRCLRPIAVDKTLTEIWHFRLKGVSPAINRRATCYFNVINSPATVVNADDLENWARGQAGLASRGRYDWVSLHRDFGGDTFEGEKVYSNHGTSESFIRNQFKAWVGYMGDLPFEGLGYG
jgi:phenylpropionate dioxygenase-like ring-hydroxylating dioxygenase large terminal subunit